MSDIIDFSSKALLNKSPDEELLKSIENLLRLAKEGEIRSLAFCVILENNDIVTSRHLTDRLRDIFSTIGALDYLKARILEECID